MSNIITTIKQYLNTQGLTFNSDQNITTTSDIEQLLLGKLDTISDSDRIAIKEAITEYCYNYIYSTYIYDSRLFNILKQQIPNLTADYQLEAPCGDQVTIMMDIISLTGNKTYGSYMKYFDEQSDQSIVFTYNDAIQFRFESWTSLVSEAFL